MTTSITVRGLRDGQYTGGTAAMLRALRSAGHKATVARTGRVTIITATGERRVYALQLDLTVDPASSNSPLKQACKDLRVAW